MRSLEKLASRVRRAGPLLVLALAVAACSGGGGGGGSSGGAAALNTGSAGSGGSGSPFTPNGNGMDSEMAFDQTVYPLVSQYCTQCHAGAGPGFPHIAHVDLGTAHRAVIDNQKANFATPNASRLVQRLVTDQHYCWSACASDGMEMETAIADWATLIGFQAGGNGGGTGTGGQQQAGTIASFSNSFANATQIDRNRDETGVIARYLFDEEQGTTARDSSVVTPSMDLTLEDVAWVPGGGIEFTDGRAIASEASSVKLYNEIASGSGSQQYSIEAWLLPANTDQEGPARIVSYSNGTQNRNFTLGQVQYSYNFRNRAMGNGSTDNGTPALQTADADEDLQAVLQHVVVTYDQANGRSIYVNGRWTEDDDPLAGAPLINWNPTYRFLLGNETGRNRDWAGQIRMVAIYDRALPESQIVQNYQAGAADRFVLRFGLDDWIDPGAYVEFTVSDYDAYSYLFCFPTIVTSQPNGFTVTGIRIAVNGSAPVASQSFANVDTTITAASQTLSPLCSVVPKDLGLNLDQFAVFFDVLEDDDVRVPEPPPVVVPDNSVLPPLPAVGIRDFDRINNTMAELTGVDPNTSAVRMTFDELRQQLPMNYDIRAFVSSHQVGIAKLALEYCNELVESPALRTAFFGNAFQFNAAVPTAFAGPAERDLITNPLVNTMLGSNLQAQPTLAEVHPIVDQLILDLTAGCNAVTCDAERTRTVVKGTCAAVLASAPVHMQ